MPPSPAQARAIAAPMPLAPPVMTTTLFLSCKSMLAHFQPVKVNGITPEDQFFLFRGMPTQVVLDNMFDLLVTCSEQADGPIGAEHQSLGAEGIKNHIQVWFEVLIFPAVPGCFRYQPREFAIDVWTLRNGSHLHSPRRTAAGLNLRLRRVVDDESLLREFRDKIHGSGQLFRINQNVIREAEFFEARDPSHELLADQKPIVGLRLHDMAEAAQFLEAGEETQPFSNQWGAEVNPTNDSRDLRIAVREIQKKFRFFLRLLRLYGDGRVDSVLFALRR